MKKHISHLEQKQIEQLLEIGDQLRQTRDSQALTLDEVAGKTMIQSRLLRAIENGDLHHLPEPIYIRGFIKRYADVLGMNGSELAKLFPVDAGVRSVLPSWTTSPAAHLRPIHLYTGYILLIVAAVSGLSYLMRSNPAWMGVPASSLQLPPAPPLNRPASIPGQASPATTAPGVTPIDPSQENKPVRVNVTLTAQSWIKIEADGETEFQGILPEGTQKTWTANSQLTVRAGNAGAVMLTYNNGQTSRMGDPGAVEEVTFSTAQQAASLPGGISPSPLR